MYSIRAATRRIHSRGLETRLKAVRQITEDLRVAIRVHGAVSRRTSSLHRQHIGNNGRNTIGICRRDSKAPKAHMGGRPLLRAVRRALTETRIAGQVRDMKLSFDL